MEETREIQFIPGKTPALAIRVDFTLLNSGATELPFIDVRLPFRQNAGRGDLRVEVAGREVTPMQVLATAQDASPDEIRVPFRKPWMRKEKRQLSFVYTLRSPDDSSPSVTIGAAAFHLGLRGWAPRLLPPKHLLSPNPSRPTRVTYELRVPADFSVLAGGRPRGRKNHGDEADYRFELNRKDLGAFAVAGRYAKWPARGGRDSVAFWTFQPLRSGEAQSAKKIGDIWKTMTTNFGVLDRNIHAPRIVESAAWEDIAGEGSPVAVSFPGGVLLPPAVFESGIDSEQFLQIVGEGLARNWFDEAVRPSAEAEIGMGGGLPEYASIVAGEARNGPLARRQRIYDYLRRYDAAVKNAAETPIADTTAESTLQQRRIALAKSALFYIELEDVCGEASVRAGLAHMLTSMHGQEVDYHVLRSVLEESAGRGLGEMFREWLNQKGIPQDFRARYPGDGAKDTKD